MFYNFLLFFVRIFYKIFFNVKVHGIEHYKSIDNDEGLVICANHKSNLDPITLAVIIDRPIHFMAKKELFEIPILSKIVSWLHAFPVDRDSSDIKSLKNAIRLIKTGNILGIFIEGTRVKSYDPNNAKSGPILIANMSKSGVLPVYIESDYKLFKPIDIYIRPVQYINLDEYQGSKNEKLSKSAKDILQLIYKGDKNKNLH